MSLNLSIRGLGQGGEEVRGREVVFPQISVPNSNNLGGRQRGERSALAANTNTTAVRDMKVSASASALMVGGSSGAFMMNGIGSIGLNDSFNADHDDSGENATKFGRSASGVNVCDEMDDAEKISSGVFKLDENYIDPPADSLDGLVVSSGLGSGKSTPSTSSHAVHRTRVVGAATATTTTAAGEARKARKPVSMQRAKHWSVDVENAFRFQLAGYKDEEEYLSQLDNFEPELWDPEGVIKCLRSKKTGYFMYFRRTRECDDKFLNRIILYQY